MADVTLVLDNADGLLPVDFQVLELGRRLYRSGENDYLLNKSRIRLRDLVDLLDAAHLADNAFLFIGQGMVDQALALRPEERRPLFEEVAGVRRHERRRRRAEEQLVESEANLARVEDILGELRPQARRLAAQAEQQASRETTADELAAALLLAMHARWHEAAGRLAIAEADRAGAQTAVDGAMTELAAAESAASALSEELGARAAIERERREAHDDARAAATAAQLRDARLTSELAALERDRRRLIDERSAAEAELTAGRRALAAAVPARDLDLEAELGAAERELAHAVAELEALRTASQAQGEELAALRRAAAARQAEAETARRRLAEVERRAVDEDGQAEAATEQRAALETELATVRQDLTAAIEAERGAATRRERARERASATEAEHATAHERAVAASTSAASARARLDALEARLADEETRGIARAARRAGGRRLDEDLDIDPALRAAAEAALAEATRAYVVGADAVPTLAAERGSLVITERAAGSGAEDARDRRFREAIAAAGGGTLDEAVRRDTTGVARRLLVRAAWLPDLTACLAIQATMPPGWIVVTRDGSAIVTEVGVTLGAAESVLERRAEAARLAEDVETLDAEVGNLRAVAVRLAAAARATADAVEAARAEESRTESARRAAEEAERLVARRLETVVREASWHEAQAERLATELDRPARPSRRSRPTRRRLTAGTDAAVAEPDGSAAGTALTAWEARATELRARRDRLAEEAAVRDAARREAENRRVRAEASTTLAEERMARADPDLSTLGDRERALAEERDALRAEIATTAARETAAREALAEIHAADAADRERLGRPNARPRPPASGSAAPTRGLRGTDHVELEARLGLEALHEAVVVELAGLGEFGIAGLEAAAGVRPGSARIVALDVPAAETARRDAGLSDDDETVSDDAAALEAALALVTPIWAAQPPTGQPPARPGSASSGGASTSSARSTRTRSTNTPSSRRGSRRSRRRRPTCRMPSAGRAS